MPGSNHLDRVADFRFAQALAGCEPDAFAQVIDAYAANLFDYGHALLRDEQHAADVVHDSLIAAQAHITRLREPELLRGWLYALLRAECLHRDPVLGQGERSSPSPVPLESAAAPTAAATLHAEEEAARQHAASLIAHTALGVLTAMQREAVDLTLRHGLSIPELARVLGLAEGEVSELAGQALGIVDNAVEALVIARTGRGSCPSVAALIHTEDWPLAASTCAKLVRHVDSCPACGPRRGSTVSAAELLRLVPAAPLPADFAWELLAFATAPDRADDRAAVAEWAEPLDEWGWPRLTEPPETTRGDASGDAVAARKPARLWSAFAGAACVMLVVTVVFLWLPGAADRSPLAAPPLTPTAIPSASDSVSAAPSATDKPSAQPTRSAEPAPTRTTSAPPEPPPTSTRSSPRPSPARTTTAPAAGTLAVSGGGDLGLAGSQLPVTLTAVDGPVTWSASAGPGLSLVGGDRTLEEDESTVVTVLLSRPAPCDDDGEGSSSVTFSPGGRTVGISWRCPP